MKCWRCGKLISPDSLMGEAVEIPITPEMEFMRVPEPICKECVESLMVWVTHNNIGDMAYFVKGIIQGNSKTEKL